MCEPTSTCLAEFVCFGSAERPGSIILLKFLRWSTFVRVPFIIKQHIFSFFRCRLFINIIHIKIYSLHHLEEVTSILFRIQRKFKVLKVCLSTFSSKIILITILTLLCPPINGYCSSLMTALGTTYRGLKKNIFIGKFVNLARFMCFVREILRKKLFI